MLIKPACSGESQPLGYYEDKDCTVRALANAKGIPYSKAHAALQRTGRINTQGVLPVPLTALYRSEGFYIELFGQTDTAVHLKHYLPMGVEHNDGITVGALLKADRYRTGRYIVGIRGHVFALVGGNVVDTVEVSSKQQVHAVYTLNEWVRSIG